MFEPIGFTAHEARVVTLLFTTGSILGVATTAPMRVADVKNTLRDVYKKAGVTGALDLFAMAYRNGGFLW